MSNLKMSGPDVTDRSKGTFLGVAFFEFRLVNRHFEANFSSQVDFVSANCSEILRTLSGRHKFFGYLSSTN